MYVTLSNRHKTHQDRVKQLPGPAPRRRSPRQQRRESPHLLRKERKEQYLQSRPQQPRCRSPPARCLVRLAAERSRLQSSTALRGARAASNEQDQQERCELRTTETSPARLAARSAQVTHFTSKHKSLLREQRGTDTFCTVVTALACRSRASSYRWEMHPALEDREWVQLERETPVFPRLGPTAPMSLCRALRGGGMMDRQPLPGRGQHE